MRENAEYSASKLAAFIALMQIEPLAKTGCGAPWHPRPRLPRSPAPPARPCRSQGHQPHQRLGNVAHQAGNGQLAPHQQVAQKHRPPAGRQRRRAPDRSRCGRAGRKALGVVLMGLLCGVRQSLWMRCCERRSRFSGFAQQAKSWPTLFSDALIPFSHPPFEGPAHDHPRNPCVPTPPKSCCSARGAGQEVLIALQRLGVETIAVDRYDNAPASKWPTTRAPSP